MINFWPTEQQDLNLANKIIRKHSQANGEKSLEMIKIKVDPNNNAAIKIETADWVNELIDEFKQRYGHEQAHAIISKVLTKFYLQQKIIH